MRRHEQVQCDGAEAAVLEALQAAADDAAVVVVVERAATAEVSEGARQTMHRDSISCHRSLRVVLAPRRASRAVDGGATVSNVSPGQPVRVPVTGTRTGPEGVSFKGRFSASRSSPTQRLVGGRCTHTPLPRGLLLPLRHLRAPFTSGFSNRNLNFGISARTGP